jgi:hypothetical protein
MLLDILVLVLANKALAAFLLPPGGSLSLLTIGKEGVYLTREGTVS